MSNNQTAWLTASDAAGVLKCSARQVHRYAEAGQLVTRRAGRRVLFSAESVARLADELQVDYRPAPPPGRDLAPLIDTIDQLRQRDQEFIEGQRRIEDRLERIEERMSRPSINWMGLAALVLVVIGLIVVLVVVLRLP